MVGGTNISNNFPLTQDSSPADLFGNPASISRFETGGRSFILGASFEARLSELFSFEANVLHRPMNGKFTFAQFPTTGPATSITGEFRALRVWEFPLLLKYRFPAFGRLRPFIAARPSFRTQEDVAGTEPSQVGFSAGAGITWSIGRLRLSPTLRYTRWQKEDIFPRRATKPDQIEFLTSFGIETGGGSCRIAGRKLELGAIFGLPLTSAFNDGPERFRYLAGLTTQIQLRGNWSLEVDAIYKPLRSRSDNDERPQAFSVLTWQFPVLTKYTWARSGWSPFAAAGPSFRLSGNRNGYNPSTYGVTFGGGIETKVGPGIRLSPSLRYTRWAGDKSPFPRIPGFNPEYLRTSPNAVEVLFGISF